MESCHAKCIPPRYGEGELNKGESVCIDRCVLKYFEVNRIVGEVCPTFISSHLLTFSTCKRWVVRLVLALVLGAVEVQEVLQDLACKKRLSVCRVYIRLSYNFIHLSW